MNMNLSQEIINFLLSCLPDDTSKYSAYYVNKRSNCNAQLDKLLSCKLIILPEK